jgi:hypothetical protein
MKTKIIIAHAILLMIGFQNLYSQSSGSHENYKITNSDPYLTGDLFTPALTVDPTTYFNPEWLAGDIFLSNGEIVRNKLIKYNGLLDELFWKEPKSKNIIKLDKEAILQFHFQNYNGDTSVYFRKIKARRNILADSALVFGQAINYGSSSLFVIHAFKKEGTELIRKNGVPYEKNVYAEEPIYIFRFTNNKTFVTKSLNRRNLYTFSPGNKDKIKEFLKKNRTSGSLDNSYLLRLTQFLSTIVNH